MDLTAELLCFCEKNHIQLIGEYEKVKKTTPIYFHCSTCGIEIKKSFKLLTKYKNSPNVSCWEQFCHKCFKRMNY